MLKTEILDKLAARRRRVGLLDMPYQAPVFLLSRCGSGLPARARFRWRLGNSGTKVLFGTPDRPSTLVLHKTEFTQPGVPFGGKIDSYECVAAVAGESRREDHDIDWANRLDS